MWPDGEQTKVDIARRNCVRVSGNDHGPTIVFAHGFGCDQRMWRHVAVDFERDHRVVLFDHVGAGDSDLTAYSSEKYAALDGYAEDVVEIGRHLDITGGIFVGHSVAAMIGILAHRLAPTMFDRLVLVSPSPRYIDDAGYVGGFSAPDVEGLLDALASNYLGWSRTMAPAIAGDPDRPELGDELTASFCRTDPAMAEEFARVTFLSDNRSDLDGVTAACLVIQCADDFIAPIEVGRYMHERLAGSRLVVLDTSGHCPHLSVPADVIRAIRGFLT